jgi:hypothetical protein
MTGAVRIALTTAPTDQKVQELTVSQFATLLYKGNIYAPTPQTRRAAPELSQG